MRFRKDYPVSLPERRVRVDIAFTRARLAVFVDGCFWHRCPTHGTLPKTNGQFWERKLQRSVERDREVTAALERAGWEVLRIWEHESIAEASWRIQDALARRAHGY